MRAGSDQSFGAPETPQRPAADIRTLAAVFDAHAAHVHDYCRALLNHDDEAVGATQATFVAASVLFGYLADQARIRPWLLALARRECLSRQPARDVLAEAAIVRSAGAPASDSGPRGDAGTLASNQQLEKLELVYRHDIAPAEVPAILGTERAGAAMPESPAEAEARRTALPLASLPATVWQGTARILLDPDLRQERMAVASRSEPLGPDGFPAGARNAGRRARRSAGLSYPARLTAIVVTPAAAGLAIVVFFGVATAPERPAQGSSPTAAGQPGSTAAPVRLGPRATTPQVPFGALFPAHPAHIVLPVLSSPAPSSVPRPAPGSSAPHPSAWPTGSASSSGGAPSSSESPSPSPTTSSTPPPLSGSPSPAPSTSASGDSPSGVQSPG
jgi:DNA-directed RNA polymerase specialized sigma24 family protein